MTSNRWVSLNPIHEFRGPQTQFRSTNSLFRSELLCNSNSERPKESLIWSLFRVEITCFKLHSNIGFNYMVQGAGRAGNISAIAELVLVSVVMKGLAYPTEDGDHCPVTIIESLISDPAKAPPTGPWLWCQQLQSDQRVLASLTKRWVRYNGRGTMTWVNRVFNDTARICKIKRFFRFPMEIKRVVSFRKWICRKQR